ncbi:hypothetical protein F8M41_001678 [Gigaspora margarita]|uniref:Uncharacterized protein n=1 Tax=Gigaspora margarita TaxID=4874 RepID=A0A8H4A7X1_GIGMA|nr:hypothetical protein F8M41_001678 [Gigaspora margarita]
MNTKIGSPLHLVVEILVEWFWDTNIGRGDYDQKMERPVENNDEKNSLGSRYYEIEVKKDGHKAFEWRMCRRWKLLAIN